MNKDKLQAILKILWEKYLPMKTVDEYAKERGGVK